MGKKDFVIGIDFGTSSVRAFLKSANKGEELNASEYFYPRWEKGEIL